MIRFLVSLSLLVALTSCGIRDSELTDTEGNPVGVGGSIPPNPDWSATIPDDIHGFYELGGTYLYISAGGYMAKFRPDPGGSNCFQEFEREALFHDGGADFTSIDANPAPGETAQTHTYQLRNQDNTGNGLAFTEIVPGGSSASTYIRVSALTIFDVPICRT